MDGPVGAKEVARISFAAGSSSPDTTDRRLYDGYLTQPAQAAAALLNVARVARARYYMPPGMLAAKINSSDPVVTVWPGGLRFESFSACCGVGARYDVDVDGLDPAPTAQGTTNVDLNEAAREALVGVQGLDPLHVKVTNAVTFTTLERQVTEDKVPLPTRWIRGFAEAQAVGAALVSRATIPVTDFRRFLQTVPRADSGRSVLYVEASRRGLRLVGSPTLGSIPVGGASRLRAFETLLGFGVSVTVYGPPVCVGPGASVWQLNLPSARFTITLSPTASRGFSGEGGLLHALADADGSTSPVEPIDLNDVGSLMNPQQLARESGLAPTAIDASLARMAASGSLGYDSARGSYFHRELPWHAPHELNPRLAAARALVEAGAVTIHGDHAEVRLLDSHHRVRGSGAAAGCTCPWIARHGTSRGPCKHILAADLVRAQARNSAGPRGPLL